MSASATQGGHNNSFRMQAFISGPPMYELLERLQLCVRKKGATLLLPLTLRNNRFFTARAMLALQALY